MKETWDARRIAEIANDPSVYPWVCGKETGPLDFTEMVKDRNNIFLFGEFGGFYFRNLDGRVLDAHSMILPEGRGHWASEAAEAALNWVFENTSAQEVMMSVPKGNIAVRALVRLLGADFRGTIENGWHLKGRDVPIDVYSVLKDDWKCR
jgi:RimJ/RimL family protein N-acetyltransferase